LYNTSFFWFVYSPLVRANDVTDKLVPLHWKIDKGTATLGDLLLATVCLLSNEPNER